MPKSRINRMLHLFFYWINERHAIYLRRLRGDDPPWTDDPIMQHWKFTNVFRENDRDTIWMRQNWIPETDSPLKTILLNFALFRLTGNTQFLYEIGWQRRFRPDFLKSAIMDAIEEKETVFTGAYIVPNFAISAPKGDIIVDIPLGNLWKARKEVIEVRSENSMQKLHEFISAIYGWGGNGFLAYELVCDLIHTRFLPDPKDRFTWANAGPGAKRGLNRIHHRPLSQKGKSHNWNAEMYDLYTKAKYGFLAEHIPQADFDMRCIEHSLCEFDKYVRVMSQEGYPRSRFSPREFCEGPVSCPKGYDLDKVPTTKQLRRKLDK